MRSPSLLVVASVVSGVLLVTGCSGAGDGGDGDTAASPSAPASETTSDTPPPPPPAPANGRCYRLGEQQVRAAHVDAEPVACKQRHTTQTYLVGRLRGKVVRSADSIDSTAITRTVDERCSAAFDDYVGGDADTRTLSRVRYVWFVPSEDEFARGANWFRCDVVADRQHGTPAALPETARRMLDADDALDTWGTCDRTGAELNAEADWRMCSQPHDWKAISVLSLGDDGAAWPGVESLQSRGDACESAVRDYLADSTGALAFRWSYPTKEQWRAGRRYGLCWTRDS